MFVLAGCGRLGFDEATPEPMRSPEELAGTPDRVAALADPAATEGHPSVTADLLELYFSSNRAGGAGGFDIWRATRNAPDEPWGTPRPLAELNSAFDEDTPEVSFDGLSLWIAADRPEGLGANDIYVATRSSRTAPWSAPELVVELSSADDDSAAAPDRDQLAIVFHTKRDGGVGDRDLWTATRRDLRSPWSPPRPLDALNTSTNDADPFFTFDGRYLVFDSSRASADGFRDLFVAELDPATGAFSNARELGQLNTERADADPWISPDYRYMVFSSSRTGDDEIFELYAE
jgi:hypothetical protein